MARRATDAGPARALKLLATSGSIRRFKRGPQGNAETRPGASNTDGHAASQGPALRDTHPTGDVEGAIDPDFRPEDAGASLM